MSDTEMQRTRALVVPTGRLPTLSDFMTTQPLGTLLAVVKHRWLGEVLRADRLETHFQPIVAADSPGRCTGTSAWSGAGTRTGR